MIKMVIENWFFVKMKKTYRNTKKTRIIAIIERETYYHLLMITVVGIMPFRYGIANKISIRFF